MVSAEEALVQDQNGVYQLMLRDTVHWCTQSSFDFSSFGSCLQKFKVAEKIFPCQRVAMGAQSGPSSPPVFERRS